MKEITLLYSFILIHAVLYAQNYKYRNYTYEWEEKQPQQIMVEPQFSNEDAVILVNNVTLRIEGEGTVDSRPFHMYTQYFFTQKTRVKILTEKGKQDYIKIELPKSFDHEYDYSGVKWGKKDEIRRPKFYEYELIYFAARIIKPDGQTVLINNSDRITSEVIEVDSGNGIKTGYFYTFAIPSLNVGDELEYTYKIYYPPFRYRSSNRFYFKEKYPEQTSMFNLIYNRELFLIFSNNKTEGFINDSTVVINNEKKYIKKSWTINNLDGYGSLEGERAYMDQSYISFYHHRKEFSIQKVIENPEYSNTKPYTWGNRYGDIAGIRNPYRLEYKDKSTLEFNHLFERIVKDINDTTGLLQLNAINDTLNSYKFVPETSIGFYSISKSLADYIKSKSIREKDITHFYFDLLRRLNKPFFYGFVADSRYSKINPKEFWPLGIGKEIVSIPYKGSYVYVLPKWQQCGYKLGEMPFYLEDSKAILMPQDLKENKDPNELRPLNISFITTPGSTEAENYRITNSNVLISVDSGTAKFSTKLVLSGQYSTLTRGYYENKNADSTINPMYYDAFTNVGKNTVVKNLNIGKVANSFPYKVSIAGSYENANIVSNNQSECSVDLSQFTKHVYIKDFDAAIRSNPFYPDFLNNDSYRYLLVFDKKIEVLNAKELSVEIKNKIGVYRRTIQKVDDKTILFESSFLVNAVKIETLELQQVEDVFSEIEKNNTLILKLKVAE